MYARARLEQALQALGDLLMDRGEPYTVVAIGGGALQFRGLTERSTEDIDVVAMLSTAR